MKKFDLLGYIKKFQIVIILISIAAGILGFYVLNNRQTYTSSAIIRYANESAVEGLAPDGTEIDITEIYSSKVISEVFNRMGLDYSQYNIDDLRSRVSVSAIRSAEKIAVDEAKTAQGEEIEEQPVEYRVEFTAQKSDEREMSMEDFAREFLDEMLDVYIAIYGEEHINSGTPAVNDVSKINNHNYDYIEKAEILNKSLSAACYELERRADAVDDVFRASSTGYTFSDLKNEFSILKNIEVSDLYAYILNNCITQNRDVLIAKYENRIKEYNLNNDKSQDHIDAIEEIIESYVNMMRESGNTDITYEYILNEVNDNWHESADEEALSQWEMIDQTVEYDVLLKNYISERSDYENALIDVAYCEYILDVYNGRSHDNEGIAVVEDEDIKAAAEASENEDTDKTAKSSTVVVNKEVIPVSSTAAQEKAQGMIDSLVEKMSNLYKILDETNSEYNAYIGAKNINLVAGIAVSSGINVGRYVVLIVVVFGLIGCVGAILFGRLKDIWDYYLYVDRKLDLPNRAACDRRIAYYGKSILPEDFTCIAITVDNLREKNKIYGRETADKMIKQFSYLIRNTFSQESDCFIGVNGVGQFLIFAEHMTEKRAFAYLERLNSLVQEHNLSETCKIEYTAGVAETKTSEIFQIKDLMLRALGINSGKSESRKNPKDSDKPTKKKAKTAPSAEAVDTDIEKQLEELRKLLKD